MATPKFAFDLRRVSPLGAAEAAPTTVSDMLAQRLPKREGDSLILLATGASVDYEIGVWDETTGQGTWRVVATGSLTAGSPTVIAYPYAGDESWFYLRRTNVTIADATILVKVANAGSSGSSDVILAAIQSLLMTPTRHEDLTPHDTNAQVATVGLSIGVGGTIVYRASNSVADVNTTVVAGQFVPGNIVLVKSTGTTASQIVAISY